MNINEFIDALQVNIKRMYDEKNCLTCGLKPFHIKEETTDAKVDVVMTRSFTECYDSKTARVYFEITLTVEPNAERINNAVKNLFNKENIFNMIMLDNEILITPSTGVTHDPLK